MTEFMKIMARLGLPHPFPARVTGTESRVCGGEQLTLRSPIDGQELCQIAVAEPHDLNDAVEAARTAFVQWRQVPAPRRGELVRRFGETLRRHQQDLAELVTLETGKIRGEALGEVQEMIDICDLATGLSRQLGGRTIASERPEHRMMEQWHPLGPVGVISAFNFPVAVWAWNSVIALVCGDSLVWKPSEKTPLSALACQSLLMQSGAGLDLPHGLSSVVIGGREIGQAMAVDHRLPLISATGSVAMGRSVAKAVASRLGRSLLELGGNNATIVAPSADLELAVRGVVFGAVGTCGQRCTTLRRLIVHSTIADAFLERLLAAYQSLAIGDPRDDSVLVGPLIDECAFHRMQTALDAARHQGGIVHGGERLENDTRIPERGYYVRPAVVEMPGHTEIMYQETFAPILYVLRYEQLNEAIALQNCVSQGLSSSIFTRDLCEAELFLSGSGSDCGIANVNMGPSGAEIGGAFGGEKDTGGGRESGSDSWKAYMRRATNSINFGQELPLAQGIRFE